MKTETRYCNICQKECEYTILQKEDALFVARGSSHVEATSPYVNTAIRSKQAKATGGNIIGDTIIPAEQWLEKCGVEIKRGYAILYKSVKDDWTTRNGVSFKPKTRHEASDWEDNPVIDEKFDGECGKGIHYSPTVAQAQQFKNDSDGHFVACRVKVIDLADFPAFAEYPDKIRGRGGYTLYEVDKDGNKISPKILPNEVEPELKGEAND